MFPFSDEVKGGFNSSVNIHLHTRFSNDDPLLIKQPDYIFLYLRWSRKKQTYNAGKRTEFAHSSFGNYIWDQWKTWNVKPCSGS